MLRKGFFVPVWSCGSGDVVGGGSELPEEHVNAHVFAGSMVLLDLLWAG